MRNGAILDRGYLGIFPTTPWTKKFMLSMALSDIRPDASRTFPA
jgi:hypothetical protein